MCTPGSPPSASVSTNAPAALREYQAVLTLFRDRGDPLRIGDTLLAIGQLHDATGNTRQARDHYQEALAAYKESATSMASTTQPPCYTNEPRPDHQRRRPTAQIM
jgi:hypothetical protein